MGRGSSAQCRHENKLIREWPPSPLSSRSAFTFYFLANSSGTCQFCGLVLPLSVSGNDWSRLNNKTWARGWKNITFQTHESWASLVSTMWILKLERSLGHLVFRNSWLFAACPWPAGDIRLFRIPKNLFSLFPLLFVYSAALARRMLFGFLHSFVAHGGHV